MSGSNGKDASDTKHSTILITGGSGFVGSNLSRHLSGEGNTIVSLYHHRLPEALDNVFPVCSDMNSPELLAAPLRGVDTVFHFAWEGGIVGPADQLRWDPANLSTLPRNVQITRSLIAAMEKCGTRRIVFLSAIGASRHTKESFLLEKYLAEFFILNSNIPEKVIVRSSVIWGGEADQDKFLKSVMRVMKLPIYPVPTKAEGISPVHIEDVSKVFVELLNKKVEDACSVLEINGGELQQVKDVFKLISDNRQTSSKLGIPGILGESLLPLFERESAKDIHTPRLKYYLALGNKTTKTIETKNPLCNIIPQSRQSFKERISTPKEKTAT